MMKKNIVKGWIYCLSNQAMPKIHKIGYTEFLEKRVAALQKSGVPYPFHIEFAKNVTQPFEKEQKIHEILKKDRISKKREFFKTDIQDIKNLYELVDGLWYHENITPLHIQNAHKVGAYEWQRQQLPLTLNVRRCNIDSTIGKYVCKKFNHKPYYGVVFNTDVVKNSQTNLSEKVCCVIYEDNDREDMNFDEFNQFYCSSKKIPNEILELLNKHNISWKKIKNSKKN